MKGASMSDLNKRVRIEEKDIQKLSDRFMYYCGLIAGNRSNPNIIVDDLVHIRDLIDAEEQGLLLHLPCKVGDTVYQLDEDCEDGIYETKVLSFMFDKDGLAMRTVSTFPMASDFGKTVFLTRAEAEQALADKGV